MKCKQHSVIAVVMANIEGMRKFKGWSIDETAARLHISKGSYCNYLVEKHKPPMDLIDSAVRVFGVSRDKIVIPILDFLEVT